MTYPIGLTDAVKPVEMMGSATDAAGRTSRYVSLKGYAHATIMVAVAQGHATPPLLSLLQATAVAGTASKVLANAVPIKVNQDLSLATAAGDTLTAATAGVNFTPSAALKRKAVFFEIDPAMLDINNGFDCIAISTGASDALNITSAWCFLMGQRFSGPASPSAILD